MQTTSGDTRGIVSPSRMFQHVRLERHPTPSELTGLLDWFWSVRWDLPAGLTHRQDVVSQPGVNVSVGTAPPPGFAPGVGPYPLRCNICGVATGVVTRMLAGCAWNLAAKTTTGGFGAWCDDVSALTDAVCDPSGLIDVDDSAVASAFADGGIEAAAPVLGQAMIRSLEVRPAGRIRLARQVAAVAGCAERDRSITRIEQLATNSGVTPRTLQRMFASCAGVSPTWVIRRWRLIDAAELVSRGQQVDWASVASDLGYSDQAHLTRDFTTTLGIAPAAYARAQRQVQP
ncbi:AraC family transcriptional regulator [Williamsia sp. CHRR-6]|uniref:helix-turn-helix domain-containing protein n=1 Tax=Williamsia sp. CHRR-6 TaxID=2835871 RepID=UPI001BDA7DF3|nr:AraC family transcriptional regulator [Williamsia sp. CHRR-6]MBT0566913.1 helix-turn-helix transcriptional regulator [Williamsia sp. CHRR-6]